MVDDRSTRLVKARWFWYLPITLLVGVACAQVILAHTAALSPWSGGGFGMFSTTDAGGQRHLHAFAIRPGIRRELDIPRALRDKVLRTLTLPTEANLRALANQLETLPTPDIGPLKAVELQVWRAHFDPDSLEPSSSLLRANEVPIEQP